MKTTPIEPRPAKKPNYPRNFDCNHCNLRLTYGIDDLGFWTSMDYGGDRSGHFGVYCPSCKTIWTVGSAGNSSGTEKNFNLTNKEAATASRRAIEWFEGGYNAGSSYGDKGYVITHYPSREVIVDTVRPLN